MLYFRVYYVVPIHWDRVKFPAIYQVLALTYSRVVDSISQFHHLKSGNLAENTRRQTMAIFGTICTVFYDCSVWREQSHLFISVPCVFFWQPTTTTK